jgi:glycosyltransferase involved in cell wall biosynthesis
VKVLHIHKLTGVSGSEGHLLALLPALRELGVDARFLGLDVPGTDAGRFHAALDGLNVPHASVRCGPDVSARLARDVLRAVRAERPDLLHTHLVHADVYGAVAARLARVPFVSTRHNDDRYLLGPFRYVDRAFAHGARRLIAISDAVRRFLEAAGHDPERLVTVHYGLDELPAARSEPEPAAMKIPPDVPLVLAVGRLIEQKDHATLLRAFASVHERRPEARLAILGSGPLEQSTRALARELGVESALSLPGRTAPRDWLARADVFAHTSRWEGFGIVLLEAMLASLPVVATRVSAVPEVVADGQTGLLREPGDAVGVAAALETLLADRARARELGEAGRRRAREEFSVAKMAARTLAVYDEALSSASSTGGGAPRS